MSLLEIKQVYGGYGGMNILNGVDLHADIDEVVVIIGPNGAGKSTLLKAAFGLVKISDGTVTFDGHPVTNMRPDQLVQRGISFVPQEQNVFPSLTVQENLEMGAYLRNDDIRPEMEWVFELFPRLAERRRQLAGVMSGGERQMVAMGRALMQKPKLLLLDEPTAGLSPKFIDQTFEQVVRINQSGVGIVMVEQNAKQALHIATRGYVLTTGQNRITDTGENLLNNKEVAEVFLGG